MKRKQFIISTLMSIPAMAMTSKESKKIDMQEPYIVRAGKNRTGDPMMKYMGLHPNDVIISRKDTGNNLSVFLFKGFGVVGTPLHVHPNQDEFFTVIEGKYRFVCGDLTQELGPGDTVFLPRNIPHQWLQLSETGQLIYAVNPAGELEDFFQEANNLVNPTQKEIDDLALKHGMKHLGPPLKP